jgi:hypothetical protein
MIELYVYSTTMSPENRGVFQLPKKETQPAITSEDWTTDGSVVMHQIKHHLCPACCHWIEK